MSINTLKIYDDLRASGIEEEHARAQVNAMLEMTDFNLKSLVTKEDMTHIKSDLMKVFSQLDKDVLSVSKDIFYIKLMLAGIFGLGAIEILKQFL